MMLQQTAATSPPWPSVMNPESLELLTLISSQPHRGGHSSTRPTEPHRYQKALTQFWGPQTGHSPPPAAPQDAVPEYHQQDLRQGRRLTESHLEMLRALACEDLLKKRTRPVLWTVSALEVKTLLASMSVCLGSLFNLPILLSEYYLVCWVLFEFILLKPLCGRKLFNENCLPVPCIGFKFPVCGCTGSVSIRPRVKSFCVPQHQEVASHVSCSRPMLYHIWRHSLRTG